MWTGCKVGSVYVCLGNASRADLRYIYYVTWGRMIYSMSFSRLWKGEIPLFSASLSSIFNDNAKQIFQQPGACYCSGMDVITIGRERSG